MREVSSPDNRPKTVALLQSSYIPWKGYFDLINSSDEFILFDDAQYTVRDWRNRNRIKTREGVAWLSIPVEVKGRQLQRMKDVRVADPHWGERHWKTLTHNYRRAPHFDEYAPLFEELYLSRPEQSLSAINHRFITAICQVLGIDTFIGWSTECALSDGKTKRIVDLCLQRGASRYLSGPTARAYLDPRQFENANIELAFFEYSGYPEYPQLFPPFVHEVSVVDLIFNVGAAARDYLLSTGSAATAASATTQATG
jgi:hypothetical protein